MEPEQVVHLPVLLTMDPALGEGPLGELRDVAVALGGGKVVWVGPSAEAPDAEVVHRLSGVGLPGLVDCHTHAVWAGSRAHEFMQRLDGVSYSEILEGGGGILSTVRATRDCPEARLLELAIARLRRLRSRGVTTVEVKSGYGLEPVTEARMLSVARLAGDRAGVRVFTTFLGAHAVPAEFRGDRDAYVEQILNEQLPRCAPHADFVDAYVDRGAFTLEEGHRILEAGARVGLGIRVHAEQIAYTGAAAMAAGLGALSADHLERIDADGIDALARAGTVAVMLPGAMLYLRDSSPPVAALREAGVPLAVATDLNPGSSPVADPWTCATLACLTMGMTVPEVLRGITAVAADALARPELGRVRVGGPSELVVVTPPAGEPASAAVIVQHLAAGFGPIQVFS